MEDDQQGARLDEQMAQFSASDRYRDLDLQGYEPGKGD